MSKIAFLGLGQMGSPMATRLLQAGHHVTVWGRTHGRATPLVGRGADAASERARPILEPLGELRHVGGPGSGAAMKLVTNATLGAAIVALGEALALARSLGLDRGAVLDVLAGSQIGPAVAAKRAMVEANRYPPSFKLRHAAKDMRLVVEAAEAAGLDLREASAARAWLDEAAEGGSADLDYAAVVATILGEKPSMDELTTTGS